MNLKDVRDAVFAQSDWAPSQSDDAKARLDDFINRAYNQLTLEAPFLFFESEIHFATQPDMVGSSDDTIRVITDVDTSPNAARNAWVMKRDKVVGTSGYTDWKTDRSWDGRVIEIIESNGRVHRNRIRTIWKEEDINEDGDDEFRLTLWQPWSIDAYGSGPFTYRIYTDLYYLPDDIIEMKSARLWKASYNWPLTVLGQDEAEKRSLADRRTEIAAGQPRALFRRRHFALQGPKVAPTAAEITSTATNKWMGPEPPGKFEYAITYTWGKRDIDYRNPTVGFWDGNAGTWSNLGPKAGDTQWSENRFREPLWESPPSPTSGTVEPSLNDTVRRAIQITIPNIEYMQGFMLKGTDAGSTFQRENYAESGWHVRIYRRRYTETYGEYTAANIGSAGAGGQVVDSLHKLDISNKYYLLAEIRIDDLNEGRWIDDGTFIPDYHRPLRDINGYQSIQMYPKPDARYEVDVRCVRRPPKLVDDTDAPLIHAEAMDALIHKSLVLLYEHQGDANLAQLAKTRYNENLAYLKKRYGDQRPSQTPIQRRYARARRGAGRGIRRWWTTD